jgi:hypothetical protein
MLSIDAAISGVLDCGASRKEPELIVRTKMQLVPRLVQAPGITAAADPPEQQEAAGQVKIARSFAPQIISANGPLSTGGV